MAFHVQSLWERPSHVLTPSCKGSLSISMNTQASRPCPHHRAPRAHQDEGRCEDLTPLFWDKHFRTRRYWLGCHRDWSGPPRKVIKNELRHLQKPTLEPSAVTWTQEVTGWVERWVGRTWKELSFWNLKKNFV